MELCVGQYSLPKFKMQEAVVLGPPPWTPGITILIDIVPAAQLRTDYSRMPQVSRQPYTHVGYGDQPGPLNKRNVDRYRLRQGSVDFKIVHMSDWDGFFELALEEIVGG